MTPTSTPSNSNPTRPYTERIRKHKDGSVLLSISDDRICRLNGVGALTWMILEEAQTCLTVDEIVYRLEEYFAAINSEGELRYEVSREQLQTDTSTFLNKMAVMNLLEPVHDDVGKKSYRIRESVSGTTSVTAGQAATSKSMLEASASGAGGDVKVSKRETLNAFFGLLAFDVVLKFAGFQSLIRKVERWPTAEPQSADLETCRRIRATVDRAQMYYPKKAMCLQHSAVVTCLLRSQGVPAEMVLAAQEFPVMVHAWSEVAGYVVNDHQNVKVKHREMRRI